MITVRGFGSAGVVVDHPGAVRRARRPPGSPRRGCRTDAGDAVRRSEVRTPESPIRPRGRIASHRLAEAGHGPGRHRGGSTPGTRQPACGTGYLAAGQRAAGQRAAGHQARHLWALVGASPKTMPHMEIRRIHGEVPEHPSGRRAGAGAAPVVVARVEDVRRRGGRVRRAFGGAGRRRSRDGRLNPRADPTGPARHPVIGHPDFVMGSPGTGSARGWAAERTPHGVDRRRGLRRHGRVGRGPGRGCGTATGADGGPRSVSPCPRGPEDTAVL